MEEQNMQKGSPIKRCPPNAARKKLFDPKNWQKNVEKAHRYKPSSLPKLPKCKHPAKSQFQCNIVSMQDVRRFHENFFKNKDKVSQDSFILCHTTRETPGRDGRRNKNCNIPVEMGDTHGSGDAMPTEPSDGAVHTPCASRRKTVTVKYFMPCLQHGRSINVQLCKVAFCGILKISKFRVQHICAKNFVTGNSPQENRGGSRIQPQFIKRREAVRTFIEKLQPIESHYVRGKSMRKYLNSDLSITTLHTMYCDEVVPDLKVKYEFFRKIFCTDYNISFGAPYTDVCSQCTEFDENLKNTVEECEKKKIKIARDIHKKRANMFFKLLEKEDKEEMTLAFDCQKNLVLPRVPDQIAYYSRQFYFHNFAMTQGTSKQKETKANTYLYSWTELDFKKGSNEIASFVFHRLKNSEISENITTIRLFCDGCPGQNKNTTVVGMLCNYLAQHAPRNIKRITVIFPVPGHSFMPPDRIFGHIEKKIKRKPTIVQVSEYKTISGAFGEVIDVKGITVYDWKDAVSKVVMPTAKWPFQFKKVKRFILKKGIHGDNVEVCGELLYMSNFGRPFNIFKKNKKPSDIRPAVITPGVPPNPNKVKDVANLLLKHYGSEWKNFPFLSFYSTIIQDITDMEDETKDVDDPGTP